MGNRDFSRDWLAGYVFSHYGGDIKQAYLCAGGILEQLDKQDIIWLDKESSRGE